MKTDHFISRKKVVAEERQDRDRAIAHRKAVSEAESTLKAAGREDLLHCLKEPTELGKAYFPPTDIELAHRVLVNIRL